MIGKDSATESTKNTEKKPKAFLRAIRGVLLILVILAGCQTGDNHASLPEAAETPVLEIALAGPANEAQAEFSGMDWFDADTLVLLPQYPKRMGNHLFGLPKAQLADYIAGSSTDALTPQPIPFDSGGVEDAVPGFEGFEALAFLGDKVYLTIEARQGLKMLGYVVRGQVQPDLSAIRLEANTLTPNHPQAQFSNQSDEAILVDGQKVLTFYEINGEGLNPQPHVSIFDRDLQLQGSQPFLHLEYRLTDASSLDSDGRFWVTNYFFPGDSDLKPGRDPLAEQFGLGPTHRKSQIVERLVELKWQDNRFMLSGRAPIMLELRADGEARNWEGLVRFPGGGFLLVTDKFPKTILGFVKYDMEP